MRPTVPSLRIPAAALACLVLSACRTALPAPTGPFQEVPRYGHVEIRLLPEEEPANKWLTIEDEAAAHFITPSGRTVSVPAFRTQDFETRLVWRPSRRSSVTGLKVYVYEADWPHASRLTLLLDDVRLVDSQTGAEKVLGRFEADTDGWKPINTDVERVTDNAAEGHGALRIDMELGDEIVWPGAMLTLDEDDWSPYDQLRFRIYLDGAIEGGRIRAEYHPTDGQKVMGSGNLEGVAVREEWAELVWTLGEPLPPVAQEPDPVGEPYYAVRFSPDEEGVHQFAICKDGRTVRRGAFECVPSDLPPPLRISTADPDYFEREDGAPWLAIGENVCWYGEGRTRDYEVWFGRLEQAGANYCRIWMPPWAFGIEAYELGDYRLDRAWELDYVMQLARRHGISVMLCLDYHGAFEKRTAWRDNPYNAENGGPCEAPMDFFTNPAAAGHYRRRVRYLAARYACYSNMLSWELFNEVTYVDGFDGRAVARWHRAMARYLRHNDPYGRIITTSFGGPRGDFATWELPEIEYVQSHDYSNLDWGANVAKWVADHKDDYGKAVLFGEFGIRHSGPETARLDPDGIHLHNGMWGAVMSGSAGTAMTWWWDSYVHPNDLYHHFASLSAFLEGVNWTQGFRPLRGHELSHDGEEPWLASGAVMIEGEGRSWDPAPFNTPRTFVIDRQGILDEPEMLSKVLHGLQNHPALHNPQTFEVDYPSDGEFVVRVNGVSGWDGASLRVVVDGEDRIDRTFRDWYRDIDIIDEYNGDYTVDITAGRHTIIVTNEGADWFEASYMLTGEWEHDEPQVRVTGLSGPEETLVWLQNTAFTWHNVETLDVSPSPAAGVRLKLPHLRSGQYEVTLWDTWNGKLLSRETRKDPFRDPELLPAFAQAVAVRLRRVGY